MLQNDSQTEFNLSCKVTGQVLIETKDGKSNTYAGYDTGLDNGDVFNINFEFEFTKDSYDLYLGVDEFLLHIGLENSESKLS